ncbi:MAG: type II toxin-antitoxin system VapB family antitoxin [Myxococcales bacterium]|nr:type II toxin-antitoxin system VapB family antitoxin [Myxococcales bacterium]MCB9734637.1 type II toxin-antitoxin system VapB family antitoxin [Deltaproteobacteria bacterium]
MALNIKNPDVERLVAEVAAMAGETKTEAVRRALVERRDRLALQVVARAPEVEARAFFEREIWPLVPGEELGRELSRDAEDALLGYGPEGV